MADQIGVFRRCHCCDRLRSIDAFKPLGLVCQACMYSGDSAKGGQSTGRIQRSRGISITSKGRAWLEAERRAAVA